MFTFDDKQLAKLDELRRLGINPYPNDPAEDSVSLSRLLPRVRELSLRDLELERPVRIAARLRFKNEMGSMGFGRIESEGEILQFCIQKNQVEPLSFQTWKKLDLGDWIQIEGKFSRTRSGELTLYLTSLSLYAKCLESMPDKQTGLMDPETRQRMRYLDLMVNLETRKRFQTRSQMISFLRRYLEDYGFMEVETPILQSIPGGASARAFETHHHALDIPLFMRIAPELYLKRLLVGGFEKVFEIGKNFRNEGISQKHNPEFSMVEFYHAHASYEDLIALTQSLIVSMAQKLFGGLVIEYQGRTIDFQNWEMISFEESLRDFAKAESWDQEDLRRVLLEIGYETDTEDLTELQQLVFDHFVEPQLIDPTFITHYPTAMSPLAKRNEFDSRVTDRFELFIHGFEVANGFTELNDPVDQAERFASQVSKRQGGDAEAMHFDADYIKALSYGLPVCAGAGIGIDRLVMLFTNSQNIRDVILFPTRKMKD